MEPSEDNEEEPSLAEEGDSDAIEVASKARKAKENKVSLSSVASVLIKREDFIICVDS